MSTEKRKNVTEVGKSITLCAVDSVLPYYAAKALERSSSNMHFDEIILFTNIQIEYPHKLVKINPINSINEYNKFLVKDLNDYISTEYVLIVQWDGFIINHQAWSDEYLSYDYIGANWPQYSENSVGNGGFSLRSKKLLNALAEIDLSNRLEIPEDELICRELRNRLQNDYNIYFAPPDIANKFSYEQDQVMSNTLGFHGFWNMIRYINEREALDIIGCMPDNYFKGYLIIKTFICSYYLQKNELMLNLYKKIIKQIGDDTLRKTLIMALKYTEEDVDNAMSKARKFLVRSELSKK